MNRPASVRDPQIWTPGRAVLVLYLMIVLLLLFALAWSLALSMGWTLNVR